MPSNDDDDKIIRRKIKAVLNEPVIGESVKVWHVLAVAGVLLLIGLAVIA